MNPLRPLARPPASAAVAALLGLACLAPAQAADAQTNRAARLDFASFRIVTERNIFNANRSGGGTRSGRESRAPRRTDAFRLVGILDYSGGTFAFFDGTSSEFRKALQAKGQIAGYTVSQVDPDAVTLLAQDKKLELRVGMQVRREENGEWQVAASGELPSAPSAAPASGSAPSETAPGETGAGASDILKRLMEQKEKE